MMEFKIGDIVRVKDNAYAIKPSYPISFVSHMKKYCGVMARIEAIKKIRNSYYAYYLSPLDSTVDNESRFLKMGGWVWDKNWLEQYDTRLDDVTFDDLIGVFT